MRTDEGTITGPSDAALKELNDPKYLQSCCVVGRTTLCDASVRYEVVIGDWIVWMRTGKFGRDDAHRAGGAAFVGFAREQKAAMHDWADKILEARAQLT